MHRPLLLPRVADLHSRPSPPPHPIISLAPVISFVVWLESNRGYGLSSPPSPSPSAGHNTLLIISMDGFRADYLQSHSEFLPNINAYFSDGVKSKGIRPSFPSLTFPNHYTLATGLYPSAHGIVANSFIDPRTGARFSMSSGSLEPQWWGGEPLWVTARKAGLNAYVYFWPGSEVELHGYRPTQFKKFSPTPPSFFWILSPFLFIFVLFSLLLAHFHSLCALQIQ
jgi:predicted AlkP superfamily pyrophosphatase or phosphodiesterase